MKRSFFQLFFAVLFPCLFFSYEKTWVYDVYKKNKHSQCIWSLISENNELKMIGKRKRSAIEITCSPDYQIREFSFLSKRRKSSYSFHRESDRIIAQGIVKGKEKKKIYKIANHLWIQDLGFGLVPFLNSSKSIIHFYSLHPKDFSLHKLRAKKEKIEKIVIGEKEHLAQKVKLSLDGWKSVFWSASIWFDVISHDFLKYEGNKGPKTSPTVIILNSLKKDAIFTKRNKNDMIDINKEGIDENCHSQRDISERA